MNIFQILRTVFQNCKHFSETTNKSMENNNRAIQHVHNQAARINIFLSGNIFYHTDTLYSLTCVIHPKEHRKLKIKWKGMESLLPSLFLPDA